MAYVLLVDPSAEGISALESVSSQAVLVRSTPIGFASYHFTYSTFLARPGLWLDDLFIQPEYRNQAIGTRLIQSLCKIAQQHNCGRIDWTVDVENTAGIRFYRRMGGQLQTQVHLCRLDRPSIQTVLQEA
ncbi:MAG: GNAT family N-acetyltransferase [Cyanobacteria bacterium P01_D01_bin.36]